MVFLLQVIDWVCEEPGYIEMIVDNKLPVDLRISDLVSAFCVMYFFV